MNLMNNELEQDIHPEQAHTNSNVTSQCEKNNVACPRKGEDAKQIRFRANRLFSSGTAWYFSTREGKEHGPFMSKENAQNAIIEFIRQVSS